MRKIFIIAVIMLAGVSCESLLIEDSPENNAEVNFESLWNTVNERYSFFEYKGIDWDSIYKAYRPIIQENSSDQVLFNVFWDMLRALEDGHVYLSSYFNLVRYSDFYLDSSPNFNRDLVERNYWGDDHWITGPLRNQILQNDVGYIYYGSFSSYISETDLDVVLHRFTNLAGVIIDIRNNGGGSPSNGVRMISRMLDARTHVFSNRFKDGPGPDDFTEEEKVYVDPSERLKFRGKVVILTNRRTYSAANLFAAMTKAIPDVWIMGDWSGGGGGIPASAELPNGWQYGFSSSIMNLPDGFNIENGVPPDFEVLIDSEDEDQGIDTIIEAAIDFILN